MLATTLYGAVGFVTKCYRGGFCMCVFIIPLILEASLHLSVQVGRTSHRGKVSFFSPPSFGGAFLYSYRKTEIPYFRVKFRGAP